jgi:hypothetical protein
VAERWSISGESGLLPPAEGEVAVRRLVTGGRTWIDLSSNADRILMLVTNGERGMVVLLQEPGDAGEHLITPGATGMSDGYILDNGQCDEYPDRDTVPLEEAIHAIGHIVAHGVWPIGVDRQIDREPV